jgi:hypothetical protein
MNYTPAPTYPLRKRDKNRQLKDTATDVVKLLIIFLVVIIIGCVNSGH